MFFQEGQTPDTTSYLILGYAVIFLIMGIYLWSLKVRRTNLEKDLDVLKDLDE